MRHSFGNIALTRVTRVNVFNMRLLILLAFISHVYGNTVNKNDYKDQFCTDPRTMAKHRAYSEWADAYSCTRHRCQPGGRNLAIYTVGCKRVEAPESAIECEEVVEDTNMQFPFCCTRLRCLVVVRGEVWTRVLGQPWETLPAAPWSHMYKMKKPPPADITFFPKTARRHDLGIVESQNDVGPIYELTEDDKKTTTDSSCNDVVPRAKMPSPDIVIALSTNEKPAVHKKGENTKRKWGRKALDMFFDDEREPKARDTPHESEKEKHEPENVELDVSATEKPVEGSEEKSLGYQTSQRAPLKAQSHEVPWTEIPQSQWNHDAMDLDNKGNNNHPDVAEEKKEEKPNNLQALVDAIGTRMRDIEHVVQKMSEKVQQVKPPEGEETKTSADLELSPHNVKSKRPSSDSEVYKRFATRKGSKYLHTNTESTSEQPLHVGDNANGYFSDASNNVLRRATPKEPAPTYMAPVDTHHKITQAESAEMEKKKKRHNHKKRRSKTGHPHKKHRSKEDKKKYVNNAGSAEIEKNYVVSMEDSSGLS